MKFLELMNLGCTFEEFINMDKDINGEKALEMYANINLPEAVEARIKAINHRVNILVFAEIWCPDCLINVPALQKLKDTNSNIHIRILPRDGNEEVLAPYKVGGKIKIPTFIVLDKDYKEIGSFIETPIIVRDVVNRGNQVEIIVAQRKYRKGEFINNTIEELLNIIEKIK